MSDHDESPGHISQGGSHAGAWATAIVAILVLYVLSPPPLAWAYDRAGMRPPTWPRYFYAPIILVYGNFEPVKKFYDGYAELLGVHL